MDSAGTESGATGYGLFKADIAKDKIVYEKKPTYYAQMRSNIMEQIEATKNHYSLQFSISEDNGDELNVVQLTGNTEGTVTFEKSDDGYIVSSTQELDCVLYGNPIPLYGKEITHDEYIGIVQEVYNGYSIDISGKGPYLMKYNTAEKKWYSYIDKDGDSKFETKLVKGDVNSDGIIDARDATEVLTSFAEASVGKQVKLSSYYADVNNDDIVDARDATQILTEYAKLSVDNLS